MITCNVHSSLEAVGFMAVIATRLAELGMGVNPISGFYHDHLFVPAGREDAAMRALGELATEAKAKDKGEDGKAREVRSFARETRSTRWEVAHEMSPHTGYSDLAL